MTFDTLTALLEAQLQLLEEFLNILNRETGELSDIQLDAIDEINRQKEDIAARIEAHSSQLRKEIKETAVHEGLLATASLGDLVVVCNKKGEVKVPRLHGELGRVAGQIRQTITINREIAERFAASVANSLALLTRVINQSNIYGASGGYQQRTTGAVMINREA
jgi:flagellar biosynthesis/type III secretory pathway chaperone